MLFVNLGWGGGGGVTGHSLVIPPLVPDYVCPEENIYQRLSSLNFNLAVCGRCLCRGMANSNNLV